MISAQTGDEKRGQKADEGVGRPNPVRRFQCVSGDKFPREAIGLLKDRGPIFHASFGI